jgi:hypothetical protein
LNELQGGVVDLLLDPRGHLPAVPLAMGEPSAGLLHELAAVPASEWIVAMVCAMLAAIAYEVVVKRAVKGTKKITLMLPVLLLKLTRLTMSRGKYRLLYGRQWYPDLHDVLTDTNHRTLTRYLRGLRFSLALVLGGAIRAARQTQAPARPARRRSGVVRMITQSAVSLSVSLPVRELWQDWGSSALFRVGVILIIIFYAGTTAVLIWRRRGRSASRGDKQ